MLCDPDLAAFVNAAVPESSVESVMSFFGKFSSSKAPSSQTAPQADAPAPASEANDLDARGLQDLLARLYREIGVAAVAAELDLQQYGPRSYRRPASLADLQLTRESAARRDERGDGQSRAA